MKILHVVEGLRKSSGVTTFVEGVVPELRKLGHEVEVKVQGEGERWKADAFDVVHIHGLWSPFLHRASVSAKRAGVPVVWSTHGMTAPWSLHHKWWKKCIAWHLYQKRDLKRAAFIHSTVEQEAKWNSDLGFTRGFIVPLGTVLPIGEEKKNVGAGVRRNFKTLLFVGRIYPVKAIDRLITAFCMAQSNNPTIQQLDNSTWKLRIVGPDQAGHQAELEALCRELGLPCEFAGPKFGPELEAEYRNCDCLALVSHTENFGATVVDAMAHCKPVITSTNTPWREVALTPDRQPLTAPAGWWVDNDPETLSKAIAEMMALTDAERFEMGKRGRALVEQKYTWTAVAQKLEEAYVRSRLRPGPRV